MGVLFILIGISIMVAMSFLAAFLWSIKNGQYNDDYTPSVRILFDDEPGLKPSVQKNQTTKPTDELCR